MQTWTVDAQGWLHAPGLQRVASPNADARPEGMAISLLVIHNISLPPGQFLTGAVQHLFCNALKAQAHPYFAQIAQLKVSAHFFIDRFGGIYQFVSTLQRAWHAGASQLTVQGALVQERCNDFSLGIELEGCDDLPYSQLQYRALSQLTVTLMQHYPIAHVRGHHEIAPLRKTDPGPAFDWALYKRQAGLTKKMRAV
jgi:N-acetyl-anhydromuramoyl-L-alanine amidase